MACCAYVLIGKTRLDKLTPCSLTAVGQRRDTTVATRTKTTRRGATRRDATPNTVGTGCSAALDTVVRIPSQQ